MMAEPEIVTVELTDGVVTKPAAISKSNGCGLKEVFKIGKNKFRKAYKFCLLYDKIQQAHYRIETDEDLQFALQRESPCFLLTNKLPEHAQEIKERKGNDAVCFVIGNATDCEDSAIHQLQCASQLPNVLAAIGMPDLHAGKGIPIGAAVVTKQGTAYPQLVDTDIGCGMSFVETTFLQAAGKRTPNKLRKLADRLESIDCPYANVETMKELCEKPVIWASKQLPALSDLPSDEHYMTMGTIGGGNHFAEFQEFQDIMDAETIRSYGIDTEKVHLLVHSGSRSLGADYIAQFCDQAKATQVEKCYGHYAADTDSQLFQEYLHNHDIALNFAVRNRQLIAKRLLDQFSSDGVCKIDIHHNFLERIQLSRLDVLHQMAQDQGMFPKRILTTTTPQYQQYQEQVCWIHRKGATPTTQSPILVIPGSRGSLSYLVEVNTEAMHGTAYSLAHGAGRQMTRSKARAMNSERYSHKDLLQTDVGGVVVCEKKDLVYEEAPSAYKDVDSVVRCLAQDVCAENGGLVRILATLRPILTYKYKDPYK